MHVDTPPNPNGLMVLCDRRTQFDCSQHDDAVLRRFSLSKVLPRGEWLRTIRVAAFDPHTETSASGRAAKRDEINTILARIRPRVCVVMASRKKERKQKAMGQEDDDGDDRSIKSTLCWEALKPPASIEQMAGTFWRSEAHPDTLFVALQNRFNHEHVFNWQIANHLQRAWRVAVGKEELLPVPVSPPRYDALTAQTVRPAAYAIDIETIPSTNTITMIGISDGHYTASVPWDAYHVHGTDERSRQANVEEMRLVRRVLASPLPKILHNAEYDIPFLRSRNIEVHGAIIDTMLQHAVVYKQFRHGLQACVANEFAVPPWKTLFGYGRDRSPDPQVWAMRQRQLADYNSQDTLYTWFLAQALAPKVGVPIP